MARSFIGKVDKVLGPNRDIPAPDVGTNAQVMAWFMDEYGKLHGHTPAIVTGKPLSLEGSAGREAATGRGVIEVFKSAAQTSGIDPSVGTRGHPGLRQRGLVGRPDRRRTWAATVVAVSDAYGAVRSDAGIDAHALAAHVAEGGKVTEFDGVEEITPDELLATSCDLLVPAALGGMIHEGNADSDGGQDDRGGRERPHHARGRRAADGQGRDDRARPAGQRRRRGGVLPGVGAEPPALQLGRAGDQRPPGPDHAACLRRGRGASRGRCVRRCAWPRSSWASSAWWTPPARAATSPSDATGHPGARNPAGCRNICTCPRRAEDPISMLA